MKIGLAQINTIAGDLSGNKEKILTAYKALCAQGAELVLLPELAVCGYPPRDLLLKSQFPQAVKDTLDSIASEIKEVPALIGTTEMRISETHGRPLYNAVAWCEKGEVKTYGRKSLLPNYDVFDEVRYFEPAEAPLIYKWKEHTIGLTICEDIWASASLQSIKPKYLYQKDPIDHFENQAIDLLINLSASPWYVGKKECRETHTKATSQKLKCPVIYCNSVGGNDELIFDGASYVTNSEGTVIDSLPSFEIALKVIDTESAPQNTPEFEQALVPSTISQIHDALTLGLKDYAEKSGFKKVLVGLSGGIDSAVVAGLAVEALGADHVMGVAMPSEVSSEHSLSDAEALAENLGIKFKVIPIKDTFNSVLGALEPNFENATKDVTEENIQARIRGLYLMALSNKFGSLLLTTGNKSEIAVGYCTLYGDMCGGLAVISDVPKMAVYSLAEYINRDSVLIPQSTLTKEPSAELSLDQKDQDSLPPYPQLDALLELYVEQGLSASEIIAEGFDSETVYSIIKKVDQNEYKRNQSAPGLKISPLAFGIGRRMPLVQKYQN